MKEIFTSRRKKSVDKIHFYCVFCGAGIDAESGQARRLCQCPKCSLPTPVPTPPHARPLPDGEMYAPGVLSVEIKFPCSRCGARLGVDARNAGEPGICPICSGKIKCPQLSLFVLPPDAVPVRKEEKETPRAPIRLSSEEIEFLSQLETAPAPVNGAALLHAS